MPNRLARDLNFYFVQVIDIKIIKNVSRTIAWDTMLVLQKALRSAILKANAGISDLRKASD